MRLQVAVPTFGPFWVSAGSGVAIDRLLAIDRGHWQLFGFGKIGESLRLTRFGIYAEQAHALNFADPVLPTPSRFSPKFPEGT